MSPRTLADVERYRTPGRKPLGIAAALLPFDESGNVDEDAFAAHLGHTHSCGLVNAVNMDTGYANYLSAEEKRRVLTLARQALGPSAPLVAGAYIEGMEGDPVDLYRREISVILEFGATPILFQTSRLHGLSASQLGSAYAASVQDSTVAYAFELGRMFAPNGEIWSLESVRAVMEIPNIVGMKHSSLDRLQELDRIELRDQIRPDFRIFTGNDLGINMIEYGSDYLLGLATFCPEKFAERDSLWESGSADYLELADSLQHLGNVAFRDPVPAYKHSAAHFLKQTGRIRTPLTHPKSALRPPWEDQMMRQSAQRLGLVDA